MTNAMCPVRLQRRVMFGDCDPAGMVFTPRYAAFAFDAVEHWLEAALQHSIVEQLSGRHAPLPVRSYTMDLRRSLRPGDTFTCTVWIEKIGTRSFTLLVAGTVDGAVAFIGHLTCVATDKARTVAAPLGEELLRRLGAYVEACGPTPAFD
jgi:acyl-CoA thioester hydrolase